VKGLARVLMVLGILGLLLFTAWRLIPPSFFNTAEDTRAPANELIGTLLPELANAAGWLNVDHTFADSLRGHPTVVALWSDTDPECLRALPILESWHQAYARYGARVVGVHEPDFAFAADSSVPARVTRRMGLSFPIALDPSYVIRRRLGGPSDGPRLVFADSAGRIVSAVSGAGQLPGIERKLRGQLKQLHPEVEFPSDPAPASVTGPRGPAADAAASRVVPLGSTRVREGPLAGASPGRAQSFTAQFRFQVEGAPYVPYPVGLWSPGGDGVTAARSGAENFIALRYDAGALWAVLSPPRGETVRVWVLRDERWLPADALGADARLDGRGNSYVDVDEPRLYAVCRGRPGGHVIKLSPDTPGIVVHALIVGPAATAGATPE
jgi:thiol-disulfide isomerase/thioredoxin